MNVGTVKVEITNSEAIVIMGSDGLFEFLSNEEVNFYLIDLVL